MATETQKNRPLSVGLSCPIHLDRVHVHKSKNMYYPVGKVHVHKTNKRYDREHKFAIQLDKVQVHKSKDTNYQGSVVQVAKSKDVY